VDLTLLDQDGDGYTPAQGDCDDGDATVNPGATEEPYNGKDDDCDPTTPDDDLDGDTYGIADDCDDNDASIYPGATEIPYDGIDQDCDGAYLNDVDGDGYDAVQADGDDCDDNNPNIHPGATEIPNNGIDEDCDGSDLVDLTLLDQDGDGYTPAQGDCDDADPAVNPGATEEPYNGKDDDCDPTTPDDDLDGDGHGIATDCNDNEASIYPGAAEIPYDGIDQDCDGSDLVDVDGDGYDAVRAGGDDCDDNNPNIHPGAEEVCDGVDNDCDGQIDEGVKTTYYEDSDSDGYGNAAVSTEACEQPEGYVLDDTDCDDNDASINPDALEVCDGIDNNCDGQIDEGLTFDVDGDGFTTPGSCSGTKDDCDDTDPSINPGAAEVCDGVDNDCDGQVDEGVKITYYEDSDSDGYGNAAVSTEACEQPIGYVLDNTDCDDSDPAINPGAAEEPYNGKDDDCDPTTPDDDLDGDTYGIADDCDDNDASIYPGATEIPYDGIDQDCDGAYLNDVDGDGYDAVQADGDDCNDNNPNIHPGATEIPNNGIDEDCDGSDLLVDSDGDGVFDNDDICPNQGDEGYGVDASGCPNPPVDSDGDGVFDNDDICPNQGDEGYGVDASGCPNPPVDSDGDGIFDNDDTCPNQGDEGYGVDGTGCPNPPVDSDGDGIFDNDDSCPNQGDEGYGVDGTGCPNPPVDSDGDGVYNNDDTCPNQGDEGYGVDASGCPNPPVDSDGDGVYNNDDTCPNQGDEGYGVDSTGCPNPPVDSDGDGVFDNDDACPNQGDEGYGVDASGCPLVAPELSSLEIFPGVLTLTAQGETHQLSVTGKYSDSSSKNVTPSAEGTTYNTGDSSIASITPEGLVTAVNNGTTNITVNNDTQSSQLNITVEIQTEEPYDPTAYINGIITDYKTGQPVAGASIEELTLGTIVNTDAEGKFIYPVPEGGNYILFIEKAGYVTAKKEVIVDPAMNTTIEESLTPYETYKTHIDAEVGGVATNEAGTIEMDFPPGALPHDIDISATRLEKEGYPVPLMKGQEFIDSVQFEPEHIDFNEPVTVRFSNKWGFPPGTEIPFAFGSHEDHDDTPEFPYFDPGMGQVSADGQWVEIILSHFSCPSLVLPSCGSAHPEDPVPDDKKICPVTDGTANNGGVGAADIGCSTPEPIICGGSKVFTSSGILQISHQMTPYKTFGVSNGLTLTYRSNTADTGRILDLPVFNNTETTEKPEQITFTVEVEGVSQETHFSGNTGDFAIGYYYDGKNAQGETLSTGVYQANFTVSNDYRKYFYTTDTFGGQPLTSTGVPVPEPVSYSNNTSRNLIINNQIDSPYGAGWGMAGIDRLYPVPNDPESALLVRGNGTADYFTLSSDRSVLETVASGLNYPTGIVYDSKGDLLVADKNSDKVLRITPSGEITTELTVSSPNGLAIASNDDLYVATTNGQIYKIDAATNVSALYFTLPTSGSNSQDIEIDSQGNLYVYDTGGNHYLYKIDVNKQITTLIEGSSKLLVSSMAVSPDDELYLAYNNSGFIECGSSWIARYTIDGILVNFSDRLNSPAGITFGPDGTMYVVERECGEQEYKVYTIDKFGAKNIFNHTPVGQDPDITLAQLTHDIAWGP
jgi:hypothetical protein